MWLRFNAERGEGSGGRGKGAERGGGDSRGGGDGPSQQFTGGKEGGFSGGGRGGGRGGRGGERGGRGGRGAGRGGVGDDRGASGGGDAPGQQYAGDAPSRGKGGRRGGRSDRSEQPGYQDVQRQPQSYPAATGQSQAWQQPQGQLATGQAWGNRQQSQRQPPPQQIQGQPVGQQFQAQQGSQQYQGQPQGQLSSGQAWGNRQQSQRQPPPQQIQGQPVGQQFQAQQGFQQYQGQQGSQQYQGQQGSQQYQAQQGFQQYQGQQGSQQYQAQQGSQQYQRQQGSQQYQAQQGSQQYQRQGGSQHQMQPVSQQPSLQQQTRGQTQQGSQQHQRQPGSQHQKQPGSQQQQTQRQPPPKDQKISGGEQKSTTVSKVLSLAEQMQDMTILPKKQVIIGKKGRKIQIETNHLSLNLGNLIIAYHFDVQITPETPKKFLNSVMEEFRRKHFPRYHPAFDGRKNLYSPHLLVPVGNSVTDEITIKDGDREKTFKVQVQYANEVDLSPLRNTRMTQLSPQEARQCVEIVLRNAPAMCCIQAGSSFFTRPPRIIDLGEGMEMYQGFYQSVVRGWKPLVNVDVAHKAFPKEMNVIDLIMELNSNYRQTLTIQDLQSRQLDRFQVETVTKFLRTLRIVYEIRGQSGSKREYSVNGLDQCPREKRFRVDNDQEMTIEEYFARKKNYRLHFPLMPTLWVGSLQRADKILLPVELCTVLPNQTINRKMTENQTSAMIKHAATSTDVRKQKIVSSLQATRHNQNACIKEFGFSIGGEFEKIVARVLEPPALEYNNNRRTLVSRGVWRQDAAFLKGAQINAWTIISTCGPVDMNKLADMIFNFGPKAGMIMNSRAIQPFEILRGRVASDRDIESTFKKCRDNNIDLIFVIIPDSGPTYSDVKKAAELNIGCLTQCIKRRTLNKLTPPTVNNILLKVNSKMNGTNHCLNRRPPILDRPCMIMGADVTHPSPDAQQIPSVVAVTASHDPKAFCYNICVRLQSPRLEIIEDLEAIVVEQLNYFWKVNRGQRPERIVFFRDGVSEGDFPNVIKKELMAIRRACKKVQADGYEPKITFLVVQKRHHTRFFPLNQRDSEDRNFNVPAGTCVDTDITNPMMQDFYLVSHASIQGVAKPTKYCTLWDDNDMDNDEIEELTYHLCHLFTRCNRSVSYPAPTYYAHLAAARAKVYIETIRVDLSNLAREQKKIDILDVIRKNKPMFFV